MPDLICANTTLAEVKAKLTAAVTGDRVLIPAGTVTVTSSIGSGAGANPSEDQTLKNKAITIEGGYGGGETIFVDMTPLSAPYPDRPNMLYWNTINTAVSCIKKMTFTEGSVGNTVDSPVMILGTSKQFRFSQCRFYPIKRSIFTIRGEVCGVCDNSYFSEINHTQGTVTSYVMNGDNWGGLNSADVYGDRSWSVAHTMGTTQAFYYEDCEFDNSGMWHVTGPTVRDGWVACRVACRHCVFRNHRFSNHGTESGGRFRGSRQMEVYENQWILTNGYSSGGSLIASRGGTSVQFNNTVTTSGTVTVGKVANGQNQRNDLGGVDEIFQPWAWAGRFTPVSVSHTGASVTVTSPNRKGGTKYHGFNNLNDYVRLEGFTPSAYNGNWKLTAFTDTTFTFALSADPGSDPTVMGECMSPWDGNTNAYGYPCLDQVGAGPGVLVSSVTAPVPPTSGGAAQTREPVYHWNNTINGVTDTFGINGTQSAIVIQEGRDYFNAAPSSSYYTPLAYPHPLNDFSVSDTTPPAAPTGLTIS